MKKMIFLIFTCMCCFIDSYAQKLEGSLAGLKAVGKARYEVVFTEVYGLTEEDFAVIEEDWEKDKPEIIGCYYEALIKKLRDEIYVGSFKDAKYTLKMVIRCDRTGDCYGELHVMQDSIEEAIIEDV